MQDNKASSSGYVSDSSDTTVELLLRKPLPSPLTLANPFKMNVTWNKRKANNDGQVINKRTCTIFNISNFEKTIKKLRNELQRETPSHLLDHDYLLQKARCELCGALILDLDSHIFRRHTKETEKCIQLEFDDENPFEPIFECLRCKINFVRKGDLLKHIKEQHA